MEMEKDEERSLTGRGSLIRLLLIALITPVLLFAAPAPLPELMEARLAPQDFPQATGYVNDFAGVIDSDNEARIRTLCEELESRTGAELVVVTVATVGDMDYADYATRLFEKWGIGKKDKDNGVMLFLTVGERRVRIDVGYGLEGILPDITSGHILDNYVMPEFRSGDFGAGLLRGATAIAGVIAQDAGVQIGEEPPPRIRPTRERRSGGINKLFLLVIIFLVFMRPRWLLPFLLMSGGRRGGGWGGGFGGGFGGGGFGGFGGGGGGGGAGRSF
jgi:uncharacterized protein